MDVRFPSLPAIFFCFFKEEAERCGVSVVADVADVADVMVVNPSAKAFWSTCGMIQRECTHTLVATYSYIYINTHHIHTAYIFNHIQQ